MPIIKRIETDMFRFADVCDYMVNPVNLVGAPGAGLALKFREICPDYVESYRKACRDKTLRFGTLNVFRTEGEFLWDIINLPTKDHYADISSPKDIERGLEALRVFLKQKENARSVVGMPMLGCGLGKQDYPTIEPMMDLYLNSLDAVVFLSMSPTRTEERPKYLVVMGPPGFGNKTEEKEKMSKGILRVLERWQLTVNDFDKIVSGGYVSSDIALCGSLDEPTTQPRSVIGKLAPDKRMIAPVNWSRNKLTAFIRHIELLGEIGTHFILIMPEGDYNLNRLIHIQNIITRQNEHFGENDYRRKTVCVLGKNSTKLRDMAPIVIGDFED